MFNSSKYTFIEFEDVLSSYLNGEEEKENTKEEMKLILRTLHLDRKKLSKHESVLRIQDEAIKLIQNAYNPELELSFLVQEILRDSINMGRISIILHFCFALIKNKNIPLQKNKIIQIVAQIAKNLHINEWIKKNNGWINFQKQKNIFFNFNFSILLILTVIVTFSIFLLKKN